MPDTDVQNMGASVRDERRERAEEQSREMGEIRGDIEVLRRTVEEQKLCAQKKALHVEIARGGGGGKSGETAMRGSTSSTPVPTSGLAAHSGTSQFALRCPNLTQLRLPMFDDIETRFGMWRSKFQACLSSLGCLYVHKATDNPVMVGDMNASQEEFEQRHTPRRSWMRDSPQHISRIHDLLRRVLLFQLLCRHIHACYHHWVIS